VNEEAYHYVSQNLFNIIVRICKFLPCPECSMDASNFLSKIKQSDLKTKLEFKNTFYLFHNWVNAKKKKPLFNYIHINHYSKYNLIQVINNFISKYHTKGNMNLINESFQRQLIIKDFKSWMGSSFKAFVKPCPQNTIVQNTNTIDQDTNTIVQNTNTIVQDTNTIVQDTNTIVQNTNTIVQDTNTIVQNTNTIVQNTNAIVQDTILLIIEEIKEPIEDEILILN
jgi:hypothetical protein